MITQWQAWPHDGPTKSDVILRLEEVRELRRNTPDEHPQSAFLNNIIDNGDAIVGSNAPTGYSIDAFFIAAEAALYNSSCSALVAVMQ